MAEQPKRISGAACPNCGKVGSEVMANGSHRCRFCGHRWNPAEKK